MNLAADVLLQDRRENPLEESIRNRLQKQRDHLFVFLEHDAVDAINKLAERQLYAQQLFAGSSPVAIKRVKEPIVLRS